MVMNIKIACSSARWPAMANHGRKSSTPGVTKEDNLTWCVRGFEEEFFVGSCMTSSVKSPRMLAGMVRDGKVDLAGIQRPETRTQSTR